MAGIGSCSVWMKVAWVTLVTGVTLDIVGFTTAYWVVFEETGHMGLWQECKDYPAGQESGCVPFTPTLDWLEASRAMATIGMIILTVTGGLSVLYLFVTAFEDNKPLIFSIVNLSIVAGMCLGLAVVIFGAKFDDGDTEDTVEKDKGQGNKMAAVPQGRLGYSFYLVTTATLLSIASGALAFQEHTRLRDDDLGSMSL